MRVQGRTIGQCPRILEPDTPTVIDFARQNAGPAPTGACRPVREATSHGTTQEELGRGRQDAPRPGPDRFLNELCDRSKRDRGEKMAGGYFPCVAGV